MVPYLQFHPTCNYNSNSSHIICHSYLQQRNGQSNSTISLWCCCQAPTRQLLFSPSLFILRIVCQLSNHSLCKILLSATKKEIASKEPYPYLTSKVCTYSFWDSQDWKMNHRMSSKTAMLVERRPSSFIFLHGSKSHWVSASSLGLPWAYNPIKKGAGVYFFSVSLGLGR